MSVQRININDLIHISKNNEIRPLHVILGTRSHEKLGEITNIIDPPNVNFQLTAADEFSFNVYEYKDGERCALWDEIITFRTVWVKEYDEWFEMVVSVDDSAKVTKKTVTCTSLCEAELSQTNMDATEINTEDDPNWTDDEDEYIPTIFYNSEKPQFSLLHRVLKKVPNYTIKHVDDTLRSIQRTFSISNSTTVYNTLVDTIASEIGCLFLFDSNERGIYVYDLETTCLECGERIEENVSECPECGSKHLNKPYGSNTTIFIDKNNLGNSLQASIDADSVKNCFKVEGGDDSMTAAIRNVNPSGSNYLYALSEEVRHDMPDELVEKFDNYYVLLNQYKTDKEFTYDSNNVENYNVVINKVRSLFKDNIKEDDDFFPYMPIETEYNGYGNITKIFYDTIDLKLYLHDSMMLTFKQVDENAEQQLAILLENVSPVSLEKFKNCTQASSESAVRMYCRALMDTSRFKINVSTTAFEKYGNETALWTGDITVTSYSDEDDTATYEGLNVIINADYPHYLTQMVEKLIAKVDTQGIKDIFDDELTIDEFKEQLQYYCYASLESFYNAYQTCLDLFVEANISNTESKLYNEFYAPYFERFKACEDEMAVRSADIEAIDAIQVDTMAIMDKCEDELDFQKYLGDELYYIFLNYRREDTYKNENYISDGLTNYELIDKANQLLKVAENELEKSNTRQYTISGNITNLLLIKDENGVRPFLSWLDDFTLGNYIHTKINHEVYNMRLANVSFDYSSPETLTVSFYDITKESTIALSQARKLLSTVKTMGSSYSTTQKQAEEGMTANQAFAKLQSEGLNSAQYNIYNEDVTVSVDEHGILCRVYDDILEQYKDNQARLGASGLIFTNNSWESTITALGKQSYTLNDVEYEEYGVNANFCIAGKIIAGDIYSANWETDTAGKLTKGTHINLGDGTFGFAGGKLSYDGDELMINGTLKGGAIESLNYVAATAGTYIDLNKGDFQFGGNKLTFDSSNNQLNITGNLTASTFTGGKILSKNGTDFTSINLDDGTFSFASGKLKYDGSTLEVNGKITAKSGEIGGWTVGASTLTGGNTTLNSNGTITCSYLIANNSGTIGNLTISSSGLSGGNISSSSFSGSGSFSGSSYYSSSASSPFSGTCTTQIETLACSAVYTTYISAVQADISRIDADYASIGRVSALEATVNTINANYVTTGELNATNAKIDNLTLQDIGVEYVYGNLLPSDTVCTGTVEVLTSSGGTVYVLQGYDSSPGGRPFCVGQAG